MSFESILVEQHGAVTLITLNRPQALNALNSAVLEELITAFAAFEADPGQRCAVLGPITMDMTMIDVTAVPGVQLGDEVVILGSQRGPSGATGLITLNELAAWADTIPWEVCCTVSKRVPRVYIGEVRP